MHFEVGSDSHLWLPCNISHQFLFVSWGNFLSCTNGFMVIFHHSSVLSLLFWVSLLSCKENANEHRSREHFNCYNSGHESSINIGN